MSTCTQLCSKTFIQQVHAPVVVTAYWTLDEAASGADRVDSVTGAHLSATSPSAPGVAALHSLGVDFTGASPTGTNYSLLTAAIPYSAGDSFSMWGWFKIVAIGNAGAFGGPAVLMTVDAEKFYIACGNDLDPFPIRVATSSDTVFVNASLGAWHFYHLFYDVSVTKFGYSLNNGAEAFLPSTRILNSDAGPSLKLNQTFTTLTGETIFDEIGFLMDDKLTAAQVTYLYNGGAGRTWPITLP